MALIAGVASSVKAGRLQKRLLLALVGGSALLGAARAVAQGQSFRFEQCRNFDTADALVFPCITPPSGRTSNLGWTTGAVGISDGFYREGDYAPFRVVITGLTSSRRYTLRIGYDAVESELHAYDYLGTYNARNVGQETSPPAENNPCSGVSGTAGSHACGGVPSTWDVPIDGNTTFLNGSQEPGKFSGWGVTLNSASYAVPTTGNGHCVPQPGVCPIPIVPNMARNVTVIRFIDLTFTANGGTAVIAWGGHIATVANWGAGRTYALSGEGKAFHMRIVQSEGCTSPTICLNPGSRDLGLETIQGPKISTRVTRVRLGLGPAPPAGAIHFGGSVGDTATLSS